MIIQIDLPGEPVSKARPRVCRKFTYDPQEKQKKQAKFQVLHFINQSGIDRPFQCALQVEIVFSLQFPKQEKNLWKWNVLDCLDRRDVDNMAKFYLDVMNGIVYEDDRQITDLTVCKRYEEKPSTTILIMPKKQLVSEKIQQILNNFEPDIFCKFIEHVNLMANRLKLTKENPEPYDRDYYEACILICELSEKYSGILSKINKKYPDFANVLREERNKLGGT